MRIELYEAYNHLDERWELFLYIDEKSNWSQWVWFGVGSVLKRKEFILYPCKPFDSWKKTRLLKKYKGTKYDATWYGRQIGEVITKQLAKRRA